jgi:hypothetical protein
MATELKIVGNYPAASSGSWWFLGKNRGPAKLVRGLWIIPSRGVFDWDAAVPIDLIFLCKDKRVVHLEEHFRPFRVSRVSLKTASVLELPTHTIYRSGTKVGDVLEISVNR